ncbi:hypothetical protein K491DRAFT_601480 [Lophiostoma macrostomum CBS 122681]|uniref:Rrn9 domain-containing protein n=1 Tax=Lophiostoma macrostomum CBS 122681 TaxID=1314788 RepID=A0A6A6T356_9PLEO|nr:hypothetical protein K491DRAFT_601480 [Lophiostoma macrostomum CBS 122681]
MSLFGGDSSRSLSPENDFPESSFINPSSHDAQNAQPVPHLTLDDDDNDDSINYQDEESPGYDDEDGQIARPNRFAGKASTWRSLTAVDRQVAAALDQAQSGDLAAHLYNAHALKRRVRLPVDELAKIKDRDIKDSWLKKDKDLRFTDVLGEIQTELIPNKRWTAWPLQPGDVPTSREAFGRRESDFEGEGYVCKVQDTRYLGDELREEMLAAFLRLAKESWLRREKDGHEECKETAQDRPQSPVNNGSIDAVMQDSRDTPSNPESAVQSGSEKKWAHIINSRRGARQAMPGNARPAFLADDDAARNVLLPSVNSLLFRLEDLAAAIRRTRLNHLREGADAETSESEPASDAESVLAKSRVRSRSRGGNSKRPSVSRTPSRDSSKVGAGKASSKVGDGDFDENASQHSSVDRSRQQSHRRTSTPLTDPSAPVRSLMDWSEVIGLASAVGWDEDVISRSAQRCASLFEEGMSFRAFNAGHAEKTVPKPVHYTSQTVHSLDGLDVQEDTARMRPYFQIGTLRCPHVGCHRHTKDCPTGYRLVEHIMRIHGYDPRMNDSDNEERTDGGVHIDGFLRPVTTKQGWLGGGRSKSTEGKPLRKRRRKEQERGDTSSNPDR